MGGEHPRKLRPRRSTDIHDVPVSHSSRDHSKDLTDAEDPLCGKGNE